MTPHWPVSSMTNPFPGPWFEIKVFIHTETQSNRPLSPSPPGPQKYFLSGFLDSLFSKLISALCSYLPAPTPHCLCWETPPLHRRPITDSMCPGNLGPAALLQAVQKVQKGDGELRCSENLETLAQANRVGLRKASADSAGLMSYVSVLLVQTGSILPHSR